MYNLLSINLVGLYIVLGLPFNFITILPKVSPGWFYIHVRLLMFNAGNCSYYHTRMSPRDLNYSTDQSIEYI